MRPSILSSPMTTPANDLGSLPNVTAQSRYFGFRASTLVYSHRLRALLALLIVSPVNDTSLC